MNFTQQKTPVIAGRGVWYSVRAAGKRPHAPAVLLEPQKSTFGVTSNETINR